jgi:hypothetical protein
MTWRTLLRSVFPECRERGELLLTIERKVLSGHWSLAQAIAPFAHETFCIALDQALAGQPRHEVTDTKQASTLFQSYVAKCFQRAAIAAWTKMQRERDWLNDPSTTPDDREEAEAGRLHREQLMQKVEETLANWAEEDRKSGRNLPTFAQFAFALGDELLSFHRAGGFQFDQAALSAEYCARYDVRPADADFVPGLISTGLERLKRYLRSQRHPSREGIGHEIVS